MGKLTKFVAPIATLAGTFFGGPAGTAIGGALGSAASSGLAGLVKQNLPKPVAPTVMPTPDDDAVQQAKKRQIAEIQARSGRASTILSGGDRLGG